MGASSLMNEAGIPVCFLQTCTSALEVKVKNTTGSLWMEGNKNPNGTIHALEFVELEPSAAMERHQIQEQGWATFMLEDAITSLEEEILSQPSLEEFYLVLSNCRKAKSREYALRLHAYMHGNGLEALTLTGNILLNMLVDVGIIHEAQLVFNKLRYRSESSCKCLIQGYLKNGEPHEALFLYQKMQQDFVHPSKHTFVAVLRACAQLRDLESGCKVHDEITRRALERDIFVGSTLVDLYAKCGSLTKAQEVFDKLPVRNVVSWNALLTGYTKQGHGKKAIECYEQMQVEGISPDTVTLLCCLKACSSARAIDKGCEIHTEINRKGLMETDIAIGNALVDMYAKCSCLSKAREVFDKLPVQDLVSWTALIAGYAEHGDGGEALKYFNQMQCKGISPDAITLMCSLKACGNLASAVNGEEIHGQMVRMGLDRDVRVCSSLVDMYAKCGLLETAREVLRTCLIRDVVSWNALITGFSKHGHFEEVLISFDQMRHEGVSPDAITFVCSLTACGNLRAHAKGEEICAQLNETGLFEKDIAVANAVVDMLAKCGLFAKANEVFNKLPVKDVVSWTALIAGYAEYGYGEEALNCFKEVQLEGIPADALTYVFCLEACGTVGAKDRGQEIHAEIAKVDLVCEDIVVGNALVDMYVKCGLLAKAEDVFKRLPVRDVVSWNAIIGGYVQNEGGQEVLLSLTQMQSEGIVADSITYIWSLKACCILGAVEKSLEIHVEIEKRGFLEGDSHVGNALVDMYSKRGSLAEAQYVFDRLPFQDVFSWNALIGGFVDHENCGKVLKYFKKMQMEGVPPDAVTFLYCLKACACIGAVDEGEELYAEIVKIGLLENDHLVGSTLVDMYARCGLLVEAKRIFNSLPCHDVVSWTALMAGFTEHECGVEALMCFEGILQDGLSPDDVTFVCCLKACGSVGFLQKGQEIHSVIARNRQLERNLDVGNCLIDMYGKCGSPTSAQEVFDNLSAPNIVSWTALIAGYALSGKSELVFKLCERLIANKEKPNVVTFIGILNACSHAGLLDTGQMYFEAMSEVFGMFPALDHLICIIDLLGRAHQLDKAVAVIKQMPFRPSPVVWHTLLGACSKSGGVELGKEVFKHAISLDKKDSSAYVSMSNVFVEC